MYRHPPKAKSQAGKSSKVICVHFISGTCSFGDKCSNRHPGKDEADEFRAQCKRIECRFGAACENMNCLYSHDGGGFVARNTKKQRDEEPPTEWWREELTEEVCDPISLEPIRELEYPPFGLGGHWFDGAMLATYAVSTSTFENPMTREPMTRNDCRSLDDYLERNKLFAGEKKPRVTEAFDLLTARGSDEDRSLRREATTLLHSLFGFERYDDRSVAVPVAPLVPPTQGQTLGDAWDDDYDDDDDEAASLAAAAGEHALAEIDDDPMAFPALTTTGTPTATWGSAPTTTTTTTSFAAIASTPAVPFEPEPPTRRRQQRRDVKMPQELWVPVRDAHVFDIRDPLERYYRVASRQRSPEVVDLHFQSSRTAGQVLDAVLEPTIAVHGHAWVVTGTGHHAPTESHQKRSGVLYHCVHEYLDANAYDFAVAKDSRGHAGAFLVYGILQDPVVPDTTPSFLVLNNNRQHFSGGDPTVTGLVARGADGW